MQDVGAARGKAVRYLKGRQQPDGTWDRAASNFLADMDGGGTGLVVLALLEGGVPADDPAVVKAVNYLVKLPPKKTYVVSLQTQVLARVDPKKHTAQIQKNVDWLVDHAIGWKDRDRVDGWSYPGNTVGDGSNTHFAVFASTPRPGPGLRSMTSYGPRCGTITSERGGTAAGRTTTQPTTPPRPRR